MGNKIVWDHKLFVYVTSKLLSSENAFEIIKEMYFFYGRSNFICLMAFELKF